jgi:hypothetical protein
VSPLHEIVRDATVALAQVDADRLEELVLCCQMLSRALSSQKHHLDPTELAEGAEGLLAMSRVLEVTRSNLRVMRHRANRPIIERRQLRGTAQNDVESKEAYGYH